MIYHSLVDYLLPVVVDVEDSIQYWNQYLFSFVESHLALLNEDLHLLGH